MIPWLDEWSARILNYLSNFNIEDTTILPFSLTRAGICRETGYPYVTNIGRRLRTLIACQLIREHRSHVKDVPRELQGTIIKPFQYCYTITDDGRTLVEAYKKVWPKELGVLA